MAKYTIKNKNSKDKKKDLIKNQKDVNDNELEIRHFFIILFIVLIIAVGLYFISKAVVDKRKANNNETNTVKGQIDYDIVSVGTILNRPYNDYYVLVYDSEDTNALYYSNLYSKYASKEDSLKIYFCDLNNTLNKDYVSEDGEGNPYARSTEDFSFGKITLLRIINGYVYSYMDDLEEIANILNN